MQILKYYEENNHKIIDIFGLKIKYKYYYNNKIYIIDNKTKKAVKRIKGLNLKIHGSNNTVMIDKTVKFRNCTLELGNNNVIKIDKNNGYGFNNVFFWISSDFCKLEIGKNSSFHGGIFHLRNKPHTKISIGDNCLFSSGIEIRTSDGHSIYNLKDKKLCNMDEDVVIDNNVWLCHCVNILKGVHIHSNIIVGTHAVVTKDCDKEYSIYAGIPCELIKSGVMWSSKSPEQFTETDVPETIAAEEI